MDGNEMDEITLGEVGRVLEKMEKAHGEFDRKLDAILVQATKTNGRVDGHEGRIEQVEGSVTWAWRLLIGLNVTVVGSVIAGVIVYVMTRKP